MKSVRKGRVTTVKTYEDYKESLADKEFQKMSSKEQCNYVDSLIQKARGFNSNSLPDKEELVSRMNDTGLVSFLVSASPEKITQKDVEDFILERSYYVES